MRALQMPELTKEQLNELANMYRSTKDVRIRTRAQKVLLACKQHLAPPCIAGIVRCRQLLDEVKPDGSKYYYLFDGLGSVIGMTNSSGTLVNFYDYEGGILLDRFAPIRE
ncbi:MAG TPA: hypothetical protein VFA09_24925 [Ktedonobacteraceae bacterium]|jgi:hypothetical protein|nr:hypothetical protein [Ktedonobacteraceae bacterium]